jgi:hypothetical protein
MLIKMEKKYFESFFESCDRKKGHLHSSSGGGNQPDIWGMAFAIWSGAFGRSRL